MAVKTDIINLLVNVNGNAAQNQLNELRKKAADISTQMAGLKKGTQEYIAANNNLNNVKHEMDSLKQSIGITSLSLKELNSERRRLTALKSTAEPLSKEFKDYDKQLQSVISRQKELNAGVSGMSKVASSSFSSLKQNIVGLAAAYVGFNAVITGVKSLISGAIKLSDQLGDLRRVTGLTKDEANQLNRSLLAIDTRTSGAGLLSIAIIAGKLGVAKEDIVSFTTAVDKLVITLGDELGDADQITTQLGKILNVFDGKVTGENISFLGNAIVDLANKGVATGGFIVDFTQRVSGIAKASNLSLAATLGLGAGFESLGLRSESSATALQKLLSTIAADIPKAAKIAGVSTKEFNELFANKPQEALIKYAEGLVKNKKSFSEITSSFKDAGEEGARVVQTLQAIAQQGDFLRKQIDISNQSIKEQNALNDGAAIKQENLAGSVEKLGKTWDRLIANNKVTKFLSGIIGVLSGAIDGVNQLIDSFDTLEEKRNKLNAKGNQDQIDFASEVAKGMSEKDIEDQQKLADSYKAIYISSRKQLADFLNSSDKDNRFRHQQLVNQVAQDGRIFIATQKQLKEATDKAKKEITSDSSTSFSSDKITSSGSKNSEYNQLKKDYENFLKQLEDLKKKSDAGKLSDADREVKEVQDKYDELLKRAADFHLKLHTLDSTYDNQTKQLVQQKLDEIQAIRQKYFLKNSEEEYNQSIKDSNDFFATLKRNTEREFAEGKISKTQYEQSLTDIEARAAKNRIEIARDYSAIVKKAAEDIKDFTIAQEGLITQEMLKQKDLREKLNEDQADASGKLASIIFQNSSPHLQKDLKIRSAKNERDAKIEKLKEDLAASGQAFTDESIKDMPIFQEAWETFNEKVAAANDSFWKSQVDNILGYAQILQEGLSSVSQILANKENRDLQRDKEINDQKARLLKKQLDSKLLSQEQYQKKIDALSADQDKKQKEVAKKQAEREKALALFQAVISTASAVVAALGAKPWTPANFVYAGIVAALGALQIAAIATAPLPAAGEGRWFKEGPKHKDPEGGIPVMIERDEAVMKADAMTDRNTYTVTGTPAQITSKLNSIHGGVSWATGATLKPKFMERPMQFNPNLPLIMAMGGLARKEAFNSNFSDQAFGEMADQINNRLDKVIDVLAQKQDALHAVVSIKEYRETEKKYDAARKAGGMSQ